MSRLSSIRFRRLVALGLLLAGASTGCRRARSEQVIEVGGVRVRRLSSGGTELSGGALAAWSPNEPPTHPLGLGLSSLRFQGRPARGPVTVHVLAGPARAMDFLTEVAAPEGVAAVRHVARAFSGEVVETIDPGAPAVTWRLRGTVADPARPLRLRLSISRMYSEVTFAEGAPFSPSASLGPTHAAYVALSGGAPMVVGSPGGLTIGADGPELTVTTDAIPDASGRVDVTLALGTAPTMREALALGARLAKLGPRTGATIAVEPRDARTGTPIAARILVDPHPDAPPSTPLVVDPTRETDVTLPAVDAIRPRTVLSVPPGRYGLRATHGVGWSIPKAEVTLGDGEAVRVPLDLVEEAPTPGWVGCDLHVHAKGSYDARNVTYEDRVRSLVAVGVDCAAATEHDHVGDHGPAAAALGVSELLRALPGVELTTGDPQFGHFNVYPWPEGAYLPATRGSTPQALFGAVHALPHPESFVFQLNHPRMFAGGGVSIGYFNVASLDPKTGEARGAYPYLRDYDALEVYNGYQLHEPFRVIELTEEWIRMLDRGEIHVATGSSDSHNVTFPWAGFPRTMVEVGPGFREAGRPVQTIVDALKKGRAFVTSGPMLRVHVGAAGIGDEAKAGDGKATARVEVTLTSWLKEPSLRLYVGAERLADVALSASPADPTRGPSFVAEVTLPAVARRRALVAVVEAPLVDEVKGMTGMQWAIAIANPVWLVP